MITLDERLALCASFVREGTALADIGTDHAYLPVFLAQSGRIRSAAAADVRQGPLKNARSNIARCKMEKTVRTVLSDGLDALGAEDADDIVMAGMGGELIVKLIDRTPWLKDSNKRLILQPMTRAYALRLYLAENGFEILEEKACISVGKAYSVMCCAYSGVSRELTMEEMYIGSLGSERSKASRMYISEVRKKLLNRLKGLDESEELYRQTAALADRLTEYITE